MAITKSEAIEHIDDLAAKAAKLQQALQTAYVAMTIAAALPGVSTEYNFDSAIAEAKNALSTSRQPG